MRLLAIWITVSFVLSVKVLGLSDSAGLTPVSETENQQSSAIQGGDEPKSNSGASPAPKPQPDASGKYHAGDGVAAPRIIHREEPDFSKGPRYKTIDGITDVSLTVDEHGNPQEVHVSRSLADSVPKKQRAEAIALDEKAAEAAKKYVFEPATFNGKPVPIEVIVKIHFTIH